MYAPSPAPHTVTVVGFDGMQTLDAVGPIEVFNAADRLTGGGAYAIELVAAKRAITTTSGLRLATDRTLTPPLPSPDTMIVAGGFGVDGAPNDPQLVAAIKTMATSARRVTSVCTGAFLLAEAGLLEDRRATTHWASCRRLARHYPAVTVDPDPIFVRDGNVWTSAGVTSGMDLALALVEDDLGPEIAREVARWLVLFVQRPGGQNQFSSHLTAPAAGRDSLRELQAWIAGNLDADLAVERLAERAHMSPRNFARAFRAETGQTPGAYVEAARIERAQAELEASEAAIAAIAARCGFGTPETMRRAFARRIGISPSEYRQRFRPALATGDGERDE